MKNYGPYRLAEANLPEPRAYNGPKAFVYGDNLPTLRLVSGGDYAVAFAGSYDDGIAADPATINGVGYTLRIDLKRDGGTWVLSTAKGNENGWYSISMSRAGSFGYRNESEAARGFVRDVIVPALTAWLDGDEAEPFLSAGRAVARLEAIARANDNLRKANEQLSAAQREVEAALALPAA